MSNMVVATNVLAQNSHRSLKLTGNKQATASSRLSSGYRINSAADDAAGLAISEKMRAQIRGLDMASKNAQDGISLIQTAEGGLQEIDNMLQRMRELVDQASNDTNEHNAEGSGDRQKIQDEINQLTQEIDSMASRVEFNKKKVVDGTYSDISQQLTDAQKALGLAKSGDPSSAEYTAAQKASIQSKIADLNVSIAQLNGNIASVKTSLSDVSSNILSLDIKIGKAKGTIGTYQACIASISSQIEKPQSSIEKLKVCLADASAAGKLSSLGRIASAIGKRSASVGKLQASIDAIDAKITKKMGSIAGFEKSIAAKNIKVASLNEKVSTKNTSVAERKEQIKELKGLLEGGGSNNLKVEALSAKVKALSAKTNGASLYFQVGANANQGISLNIGSAKTDILGIGNGNGKSNIDVLQSTGKDITGYLDVMDVALSYVTTERSKLGAAQNRLDYTIKSLDIASENLTAAESRIRDTDMAKEMMKFTQANVLQQAATSMLAQANQAPQNVLQLLR